MSQKGLKSMGKRIKFFYSVGSDKIYELIKISVEANVIIGKCHDTNTNVKFKFENLEQELIDENIIILE